MRIGLLGAGRIGRIHGANIAINPDTTLAAVSDEVDAAARDIAHRYGARIATVTNVLTAGDIDAVFICTPSDTHVALIEAAARAGKSMFCEKPLDLSIERIKTCLELVAESGVSLMIGFNRRYDPSFAEVQRRIAAGEVGAVEIVSIHSRDPSPPSLEYVGRSGGLYRDMMIHDFDMARFLLEEEPTEVYASGAALVDPEIGRAGDVDTAAVLLRTRSGKLVQISNSRRATYGYDQRIEVHGSKGMVSAGNVSATTVQSADAAGFHRDPALPFFLERYAAAYRAELAAFVRAVETGIAPSPSGYDGLRAQILAEAATESASTGRPVVLAA